VETRRDLITAKSYL